MGPAGAETKRPGRPRQRLRVFGRSKVTATRGQPLAGIADDGTVRHVVDVGTGFHVHGWTSDDGHGRRVLHRGRGSGQIQRRRPQRGHTESIDVHYRPMNIAHAPREAIIPVPPAGEHQQHPRPARALPAPPAPGRHWQRPLTPPSSWHHDGLMLPMGLGPHPWPHWQCPQRPSRPTAQLRTAAILSRLGK